MIVYNGIFCYSKDFHMAEGHVKHLDSLGHPMTHCLYPGMDSGVTSENTTVPFHAIGVREAYEDLPVRTMAMLQHALTIPNWTVFLKTDVNTVVHSIDWDVVANKNLVGFISTDWLNDLYPPYSRINQPALHQKTNHGLPVAWMGGPAYAMSRALAYQIAQFGTWYARQFAHEDIMVAMIARVFGVFPCAGIGYYSEDEHGHVRLDINSPED